MRMYKRILISITVLTLMFPLIAAESLPKGKQPREQYLPETEHTLSSTSDKSTGYIIVGESHVSKSESAVMEKANIQETYGAGNLKLGEDVFYISTLHSVYALDTQSSPLFSVPGNIIMHNGSQGSYEDISDEMLIDPTGLFDFRTDCAFPGWLITDSYKLPQVFYDTNMTNGKSKSALTRINQIVVNHPEKSGWVIILFQGYSACNDFEKEGYINQKITFANQVTANLQGVGKQVTVYDVAVPNSQIPTDLASGKNEQIDVYSKISATKEQGTNLKFWNWRDEWNANTRVYQFMPNELNHLTLESYYTVWKEHLGRELCLNGTEQGGAGGGNKPSEPAGSSNTGTHVSIDTSHYGLIADNVEIEIEGISQEFKIAWVSDLHYMKAGKYPVSQEYRKDYFQQSLDRLPSIVNCINNNLFDAVVIGGDIIDNYEPETVLYVSSLLGSINKPALLLYADHDYSTNLLGGTSTDKSFSGTPGIKMIPLNKNSDEIMLVGQNCANDSAGILASLNTLSSALNSNRNVLYFTHVPIQPVTANGQSELSQLSISTGHNPTKGMTDYFYSKRNSGNYALNSSYANVLYNSRNLKGVFAGHMHGSGEFVFNNYGIKEKVFNASFIGSIGVITIKPVG